MPHPKTAAPDPDGRSIPDDVAIIPHRAANHILTVGSLVVDVAERVATRDGRVLRLLPKQFALLIYLAQHAGQIVGRREIALDVWADETAIWTNVITVNINGLRKEIDREGLPPLLHTVRGRGYLLGELP